MGRGWLPGLLSCGFKQAFPHLCHSTVLWPYLRPPSGTVIVGMGLNWGQSLGPTTHKTALYGNAVHFVQWDQEIIHFSDAQVIPGQTLWATAAVVNMLCFEKCRVLMWELPWVLMYLMKRKVNETENQKIRFFPPTS